MNLTKKEAIRAMLDGKKVCFDVDSFYVRWNNIKQSFVEGWAITTVEQETNMSKYIDNGWQIYEPPKEREIIELFETYNSFGLKTLCDKDGKYPSFIKRKMEGYCKDVEIRKQNIIPNQKPIKLDAEIFQIIWE